MNGALPWASHRSAGDVFSSMIPATQATIQNRQACPLCANLSHPTTGAVEIESCCLCSLEHQPELQAREGKDNAIDEVRPVQAVEPQWQLSKADLRARVLDSLVAPATSESNAAHFKLHSCFDELPNWLVVASEYPPLPPARPGMSLSTCCVASLQTSVKVV